MPFFLGNPDPMDLEFLTTLLVLAVFIAAEVHRVLGSQKGIILRLLEAGDEGTSLDLAASAQVKLEDGKEITAKIQPCTMCLGRLGVGDEVRVMRSGRGYSVDLPWLRTMNCSRRGRKCDLETAN